MFSDLARGVGCWNGELKFEDWQGENESPVLPTLPQDQLHHRHGITISPRLYAPLQTQSLDHGMENRTDGKLPMPKTFLTRKGALVLFSAPEKSDLLSDRDRRYMRKARKLLKHRYGDQISKLGKLSRLAQSILIFGDEEERPEDASISDPDNKMVLKFLHDLDHKHGDQRSKPGSDPSVYLRELKSRNNSAKSRTSVWSDDRALNQSGSRYKPDTHFLSADLDLSSQFTRCVSPGSTINPNENTRPSTSCSGRTYRVLSTEKLTASLKSGGFLSRNQGSPSRGSPPTPPGSRRSSVGSVSSQYQSLLTGRTQSTMSPDKMLVTFEMKDQYEAGDDVAGESHDEEEFAEEDIILVDGDGLDIDMTTVGAQPLLPLYSGLVTSGSKESFSVDKTHPDQDPGDGLMTDHMATDLNSSGHSLQRALESLQKELPESEDPPPQGVTAVQVTSRSVSVASSHSGVPSERPGSDARTPSRPGSASRTVDRPGSAARTPSRPGSAARTLGRPGSAARTPSRPGSAARTPSRPGSAAKTLDRPGSAARTLDRPGSAARTPERPGSASRSQDRPTKQTMKEEFEENQDTPTVPPSTRSVSPDQDLKRPPGGDTGSKDGGATLEGAENLPQTDQEWENLKSKSERAETEARRSSLQTEAEGVGDAAAAAVDADAGGIGGVTKDASDADGAGSHTSDTIKAGPADGSGDAGDSASVQDITEPDLSPEGTLAKEAPSPTESKGDAELNEVLSAKAPGDNSKVQETPKVTEVKTEPPKFKETSHKSKEAEKKQPKKEYTKSIDVSQMKTPDRKPAPKKDTIVKASIPSSVSTKPRPSTASKSREIKSVKESLIPSGVLYQPAPPPEKSKEEVALEQLQREVTNIVSEGVPKDVELTAEEMEIERQLLQERLQSAEKKIKGETSAPAGKRSPQKKGQGQKKAAKGHDAKKANLEEERNKQREALREAKRLEKQRRLEEAKQLEEQIREKEETQEQQAAEAMRKQQMLADEIAMMKQEAEEARILEEQAAEQMAAERRAAREEREIRRKADLQRKKQEAMKRREHEKKIAEEARRKEREMLESIANADQRQMMEEEERRKHEEQERLEQEREEEEERELEKQMEEEEENLRELERQAEEEALSFLVREREEAEARQRALQREAAEEAEALELQKKLIAEEQERLESELRQREEEERKRQEEDMQRYSELRRLEEEAMEKMRIEVEGRRQIALKRREQNLERRGNLNKLTHGQGMTRAWTFTYYVDWPRNTYEKRMGQDPKKKGFRTRKPKPKPKT